MADGMSGSDLLYMFKAFKKTPNEVTAKIQNILEDTLTDELRSFVTDVEALNCYKKSVGPGDLERASIEDIAHFDTCIDRIEAKMFKVMSAAPHVTLPGDEFLREVEEDSQLKRIETRRLIAMKLDSNRMIQDEISLMKKRAEISERLKSAKAMVIIKRPDHKED